MQDTTPSRRIVPADSQPDYHTKLSAPSVGSLNRRKFVAAAGLGALGLAGCGFGPRSSAWSDLRGRLRGSLVSPGDPQYQGIAMPRNLRYVALMPAAVALCVDASDVATAIAWARRTGTPFAVRGGGHNYTDASSSQGLIISTRAMTKASMDGAKLQAQAGARNADLAMLLPQGGAGTHLLPGGTCPTVGIVGLTLGGGIGPNAPWAGLTADRLREVTMVTADGDIVTASAHRNPDLFWALRGAAGGNLGVVTDLRYELVEVPVKRATTFLLKYPSRIASTAAAVAWQAVRNAGRELIGGTWHISHDASGPSSRVKAQVLLPEADARSLMAPLLSIPSVSAEVVERSWWDTYAWYRTPVTPANTFWDRSLYAEQDLPSDVIERIVGILERFPRRGDSYGAFGIMGWVGGRVSQVPAGDTAYVHRSARSLLEFSTGWPSPSLAREWPTPVPPDVRDWMVDLWETARPHTTGASYQNFPDPGLADSATAYYGSNLGRLSEVKRAWDPHNVFAYQQGLPLNA